MTNKDLLHNKMKNEFDKIYAFCVRFWMMISNKNLNH